MPGKSPSPTQHKASRVHIDAARDGGVATKSREPLLSRDGARAGVVARGCAYASRACACACVCVEGISMSMVGEGGKIGRAHV